MIANRTGFETEIYLGGNFTSRYMAAAAVTAEGEILGSTYVVDMANGKPIMMPSRITDLNVLESQTTFSGAASMLGGAVVIFGIVSAAMHYVRRRRQRLSDPEKARYKRVDTEE